MRRVYPRHEGVWVAATMSALLGLFLALATFASGCGPKVVRIETPKQPLPIVITRDTIWCWNLDDRPKVPEQITLNYDDDDIIRRTTVNIREHNELLDYLAQRALWEEEVVNCIKEIIRQDP